MQPFEHQTDLLPMTSPGRICGFCHSSREAYESTLGPKCECQYVRDLIKACCDLCGNLKCTCQVVEAYLTRRQIKLKATSEERTEGCISTWNVVGGRISGNFVGLSDNNLNKVEIRGPLPHKIIANCGALKRKCFN